MENEDLASSFAAKKENEELKEMMKIIGQKHDKIVLFLLELKYTPMFWGKSYKKKIDEFCEREYPISEDNFQKGKKIVL